MRKLTALLVVLAVLPLPVMAQDFVPQNTGMLEGRVTFSGNVRASGELQSLNFSIYALPRTTVSRQVSTEHAVVRDDQGNSLLNLHWEDVTETPYQISTRVQNPANFEGAERVPFPYDPPRDKLKYLGATSNSPISPEIRTKARELTRGSDNGFEAVTELSTWIYQNFDYDNSYADRIYPADVVYNQRAGVCAEFTNLMVSMSRSVGIPARSVAGVIYSRDGWGYHAWAEVYLDGWVPVDPTWNEIGWVDASHIPLATFRDGGDVKMTAQYRAFGSRSISFGQPNVDVEISDTEPIQKPLQVSSTTYPERIGLGDSAVVEVSARNDASGCIATGTEVKSRVDSRGREVVSTTEPQSIAVCPREKGTSHFVLNARDDLERGFIYSKLADIRTFLGEDITVDLTLDPSDGRQSGLDLVVDSRRVEVSDRVSFDVRTDAGDHRLYSDLPLDNGQLIAESPGEHYLIAATVTGEVEKEVIEVREDIPFRLLNVRKPAGVGCGDEFNVSFDIENLEEGEQEIGVRPTVSEELEDIGERTVSLEGGETERVSMSTRLREECSGEEQFVSVSVGDQRIHEPIRVEKFSLEDTGRSLASRVRSLIFGILDSLRSLF